MIIARGHKFKSVPNKLWKTRTSGWCQSAICVLYVNADVVCDLSENPKEIKPESMDNYTLYAISRKFRIVFYIQGVKGKILMISWIIIYFALKETTSLIILL